MNYSAFNFRSCFLALLVCFSFIGCSGGDDEKKEQQTMTTIGSDERQSGDRNVTHDNASSEEIVKNNNVGTIDSGSDGVSHESKEYDVQAGNEDKEDEGQEKKESYVEVNKSFSNEEAQKGGVSDKNEVVGKADVSISKGDQRDDDSAESGEVSMPVRHNSDDATNSVQNSDDANDNVKTSSVSINQETGRSFVDEEVVAQQAHQGVADDVSNSGKADLLPESQSKESKDSSSVVVNNQSEKDVNDQEWKGDVKNSAVTIGRNNVVVADMTMDSGKKNGRDSARGKKKITNIEEHQ